MKFSISAVETTSRPTMSVILVFLITLFLSFGDIRSFAHEGHDHGETKPKPEIEVADPRFAVETTLFQLVGRANGQKLTLYLDHFASNAPVLSAIVDITAGVDNQVAQEVSDGTYEITSDWVATSGTHDLIISVTAGDEADLMLAQLVVPEQDENVSKEVISWWEDYLPAAINPYVTPILKPATVFLSALDPNYLLAAVFGIGLILGLFIRNTIFPTASALIALALITAPTPSVAHEGHDHGEEKKPVVNTGNQPYRLPDGSIFLPKPTQRLLNIRSALTELSDRPKSERLLGKTISDPSYTGVVQAVRDGRVGFPPKGLPIIGEEVDVGDVVATLTPVLTPEAQAGMTEQLGSLTQEIALTEQRLKRLNAASQIQVAGQGGGLSAVSRGAIEELEVQLETLVSRRDALSSISFGALNLKASRAGTISNVNVTTGQVVSAGDTLIEIVDPKRIWVEAVAYPSQNTEFVSRARAVLPDRDAAPVSFVSRSLSLTAQAETLYFRLEKQESVPIGTPVTIILEADKNERNLLVPRESVVRGGSGLPVVWVQDAPETFRPQIVKVEPFDGQRMKVKAGLNEGDRFVVEGASFLSQVR